MPTLPLDRTEASDAEAESFTTNLLEPLVESSVAEMSAAWDEVENIAETRIIKTDNSAGCVILTPLLSCESKKRGNNLIQKNLIDKLDDKILRRKKRSSE